MFFVLPALILMGFALKTAVKVGMIALHRV